jgi:hypothetical protein
MFQRNSSIPKPHNAFDDMFQESFQESFSVEEIFQLIRNYHLLNLSDFLKSILLEKKVSVSDLHKRLQQKDYCLNIESLHRYFNPSQKSNRFPSKDFIEIFAEVVTLTDEQTKLLLQFWVYSRFIKKCKKNL